MSRSRILPYLVGGLLGATVGLTALLIVVLRGGIAAPTVVEGSTDPSPQAHRVGAVGPGAGWTSSPAMEDSISKGRSNAIVIATRRASPAVVGVTVIYDTWSRVPPRTPGEFLSQQMYGWRKVRRKRFERLGSGVIVDARGLIVTNNHVLGDERSFRIFITLGDGRQYQAEVVGRAPSYDLALLRFSEPVEDIPVAVLGNSDELEPGEWAIAIGAPYRDLLDDPGLTVTVGVISALHRDIEPGQDTSPYYLDMIQTDASITRGNSGGALVNRDGEVIGINSFMISNPEGVNLGAGFAVPINRVRWVLDEIVQYGRVRPNFSGIYGSVLNKQQRYKWGLGDDVTGFFVERVWRNSPADEAGIMPGDVIRTIEGQPIRRKFDVTRMLFATRVGSQIKLQVQRGDKIFDTTLTLSEGPKAGASPNGQ